MFFKKKEDKQKSTVEKLVEKKEDQQKSATEKLVEKKGTISKNETLSIAEQLVKRKGNIRRKKRKVAKFTKKGRSISVQKLAHSVANKKRRKKLKLNLNRKSPERKKKGHSS